MRKVQCVIAAILLILGVCGCGSDMASKNSFTESTSDNVAENMGDVISSVMEETLSGDVIFLEAVEEYTEGNYATAITKCEEAKEKGLRKYSDSTLYSIIGGSYLELDMYEDAIENYTKSIELEPDDVKHYVNLGIAYRQSGDNAKAKELYIEALKIDPNYAELNSSLGSLYILEEDPEMAIRCFNRAVELDSSLAVAYGNGALAYAMMGDFEMADEYMKKAIERGYVNADVIQERIDALRE